MTKEQLLEIAKAGFPDRVKEILKLDKYEMHQMSGVYRLYNPDAGFRLFLPNECLLSIIIGSDKFIQINPGYHRAFNHYTAIKKMEELGLIK